MVEQNFQIKGSEIHQNCDFCVKTHSIIHHGWRKFSNQGIWNAPESRIWGYKLIQYFTMVEENFQFKISEMHQNEGLRVKTQMMVEVPQLNWLKLLLSFLLREKET